MVDFSELKKFFIFNLIGALIISAVIAIITVLIGQFNEIALRALFTLLMVVGHSLISLLFIWDDSRQNTFERLNIFTNALFLIIILSFVSSILGIWKVIPGDLVANLYQTYFVVLFAALHSNILSKAMNKESYLDAIIYINYAFIGIVVLMLLPIIYIDNALKELGEIYFRFLGAVGIIDGTLSILAIIFYKLYMHKHPEETNDLSGGVPAQNTKKKGLSVWVWILLLYLFFQIFLPIIFFLSPFMNIF